MAQHDHKKSTMRTLTPKSGETLRLYHAEFTTRGGSRLQGFGLIQSPALDVRCGILARIDQPNLG
jgi:hypothetical protein